MTHIMYIIKSEENNTSYNLSLILFMIYSFLDDLTTHISTNNKKTFIMCIEICG